MNRLQFYFKSQTAHGLHSPSIYSLYVELLNPYLNGQLSYLELIESLILRYPAYSIEEMEEKYDPAKVDENTLLLLRNPFNYFSAFAISTFTRLPLIWAPPILSITTLAYSFGTSTKVCLFSI